MEKNCSRKVHNVLSIVGCNITIMWNENFLFIRIIALSCAKYFTQVIYKIILWQSKFSLPISSSTLLCKLFYINYIRKKKEYSNGVTKRFRMLCC